MAEEIITEVPAIVKTTLQRGGVMAVTTATEVEVGRQALPLVLQEMAGHQRAGSALGEGTCPLEGVELGQGLTGMTTGGIQLLRRRTSRGLCLVPRLGATTGFPLVQVW